MNLDIELPDAEEEIETQKGLKKYAQLFADGLFKTPERIIGTLVLVVACIGLIGWNISRLSILDELVELEVREYELDDQLSELETKLSEIDMERLSAEIRAENDRVFQGFPELAAWAEGLARIAQEEGMAFSYSVRQAHLSPVPGVLEVPLTLDLKGSQDSADNLFTNAMALVGRVLRDHWHIDVVSTEAEGQGGGLSAITVNAQVWVKDRYGFVDLSTIEGGQVPEARDP